MGAPTNGQTPSRSSHLADSSLQPFLAADFDPADYLNSVLPPISTATFSTRSNQNGRPVPLSELSVQLQTLLSRLNAETTRLSKTLTQLTDEIIRSGGRLAYEVEVLRGETNSLTDTLENGLKQDIELFTRPPNSVAAAEAPPQDDSNALQTDPQDPPYMTELRILTLTRTRLDAVIRTFGTAMAWPPPPAESSLASNLISVSDPSTEAEKRALAEKGKQYVENVRAEISRLLGEDGGTEGLRAATEKVEELRVLAEVWKGTAEEKARGKVVDGLQRLVDEEAKARGKEKEREDAKGRGGMDYRYGGSSGMGGVEGGYGFLRGLGLD